MTFDEYFALRIKNGKITVNVKMKDGVAVPDKEGMKSNPDCDLDYVRKYGKDMTEFWHNAKSQKELLWMLRGIGLDDLADSLWAHLSEKFKLVLHVSKISEDDAQIYADIVRSVGNDIVS